MYVIRIVVMSSVIYGKSLKIARKNKWQSFAYQIRNSRLQKVVTTFSCRVCHSLDAVERFVVNVLHGVLF